jgi:hypothetical protein
MSDLGRKVIIRHNRNYSLVTLGEEVRSGAGIYPRTVEQHRFADAGIINSSVAKTQAERKAEELRITNACR